MPRQVSGFQGDPAPLFDIVSYGRRGPDRRLALEQIEQVSRTVRQAPEVMVKISGGGTGTGAVRAHFRYIGREDFKLETDEGERLSGKNAAKNLIEDWQLDVDEAEARSSYNGRPGRKPGKLVYNIILSMPSGTPSSKVLAASRDFARETFALKHRYALALHTNEAHPHTHLVVRAMSEQGRRLNIRKETLRGWRREFARHLRAHGVEANATAKSVRGAPRIQKHDGIYRANERDASTHMRDREETVDLALHSGDLSIEPGKSKLQATRRKVILGWKLVGEILERQGEHELAAQVRQFVRQMPLPMTETEQIAAQLIGQPQKVKDIRPRAVQ
jgi:hypothetical protein